MTHTTLTARVFRSLTTACLLLGLTVLTALPAMAAPSGKVNINKADATELTLLPRIGPALAQRIVEYREANEGFKSPEDLLLVSGIGEKTFALLIPFITVSGDSSLGSKVSLAAAQEAVQAAQTKADKDNDNED